MHGGRMIYLAVVCIVFVVFGTINGEDICGLENYDVSSLQNVEYWSFNISSEQCLVTNASCTIYFSVCKNLPTHLCGNDSGVCQQVIPAGKNTIHYYYSLGKPIDNVQKLTNNTGFLGMYTNGSDNSEKCNGTKATTVIEFLCVPTAIWRTTTNVTTHLLSYIEDPENECLFIISLGYSGACINIIPVIPGCNAIEHYDLSTIRKQLFFKATVPSSQCKNPFTSTTSVTSSSNSVNEDETCDLFFSFCAALPNGICYRSVFCQFNALIDSISFGQFNSDLTVIEDADYTGFSISAYDGTNSTNCINGYYTTLIFNCSESAVWSEDNPDISKFVTAEPNVNDCQFNVIFQYSGACTSYRPKKKSSSSPFGGIIIGIFFAVLILYFVAGITIQLARGKRGSEIVPNYEQWNLFFVLVLEGCQFSLDAVTCFQLRSGRQGVKHDYESL